MILYTYVLKNKNNFNEYHMVGFSAYHSTCIDLLIKYIRRNSTLVTSYEAPNINKPTLNQLQYSLSMWVCMYDKSIINLYLLLMINALSFVRLCEVSSSLRTNQLWFES